MGKRWTRLALRKLWGWVVFCKDRILLHHLVHPNAPTFDIAKVMMVCAIALLIDKGTQNPDSITSTFIAMLCIAPLTTSGLQIGKSILISSMIGTTVGCFVNVVLWIEPDDSDFQWWLVFKVPIAVGLATYALYVAGRDNPGDFSSCVFSAMYVNILMESYPPLENDISSWPRHQVLSTLIVRMLALSTALVAATIVNFTVSFWAKAHIIRCRMLFVEEVVWRTFRNITDDAVSPTIQGSFGLVTGLIADAYQAKSERLMFDHAKKTITRVSERARVLFCVLAMHSFLSVLATIPTTTEGEVEGLHTLLTYSRSREQILKKRMRKKSGKQFNVDEQRTQAFEGIVPDIPPSLSLFIPVFRHLLARLEDTHLGYSKPNSLFWGLGCDFLFKPDRYNWLDKELDKESLRRSAELEKEEVRKQKRKKKKKRIIKHVEELEVVGKKGDNSREEESECEKKEVGHTEDNGTNDEGEHHSVEDEIGLEEHPKHKKRKQKGSEAIPSQGDGDTVVAEKVEESDKGANTELT